MSCQFGVSTEPNSREFLQKPTELVRGSLGDCRRVDRVWIEYADNFSNDLGAILAIRENYNTDLLAGYKESVGMCSGVSPGVVDDGNAVVDDDLPMPAEIWHGVPGTS